MLQRWFCPQGNAESDHVAKLASLLCMFAASFLSDETICIQADISLFGLDVFSLT